MQYLWGQRFLARKFRFEIYRNKVKQKIRNFRNFLLNFEPDKERREKVNRLERTFEIQQKSIIGH